MPVLRAERTCAMKRQSDIDKAHAAVAERQGLPWPPPVPLPAPYSRHPRYPEYSIAAPIKDLTEAGMNALLAQKAFDHVHPVRCGLVVPFYHEKERGHGLFGLFDL